MNIPILCSPLLGADFLQEFLVLIIHGQHTERKHTPTRE